MRIESVGTGGSLQRCAGALVATAFGLFFLGLALAVPASAAELTIRLCGMEPRVGNLRVAVFSQAHAKEFTDPASEAFVVGVTMSLADTAAVPVLRVTIPSLVPGKYAVRVTHDENGNGTVDFGRLVGTPQEAYGYSRNGRARLSAVSFDEAAITLASEPVTIDIRLVHWSLAGGDSSPCQP